MLVTFLTCKQILRRRAQNFPQVTHQQTGVCYYKQKGSITVKIKKYQNQNITFKRDNFQDVPRCYWKPRVKVWKQLEYIYSLSPSFLVCSQFTNRKCTKTLAPHTKSCIQTHRTAGSLVARRTAVRGEIRRHLRCGCPRLAVLTIINIFLFQ